MGNTSYVEHTLEPWVDDNSHTLILGTMPSVKSREYGCYYGHKQNRFWQTIARVFNEEMPQTVEERRLFCNRHGIALWDVLASCEIHGSDDASIRSPIANDIATMCRRYPIQHIYTTGKKSKELYDCLVYPLTDIAAVALPSTSPANRRWFSDDALIDAYRVIAKTEK